MPLFTKHGRTILFTHIPKTGGSSVTGRAVSSSTAVTSGSESIAAIRVYASSRSRSPVT